MAYVNQSLMLDLHLGIEMDLELTLIFGSLDLIYGVDNFERKDWGFVIVKDKEIRIL